MVNQVIHINKKKYAVGLLWQPVGSGFSGRAYAHSLSKNIDKKLNLYTEARAMVGLGGHGLGHNHKIINNNYKIRKEVPI